jgi:hypothetical protein
MQGGQPVFPRAPRSSSTVSQVRVPAHQQAVVGGRKIAAAFQAGHQREQLSECFWVVLDLKLPDNTPGWLAQLGTAVVRPFASIDEWIMRRPWEAIRAAMQEELAGLSWTELFFGTAFLAAGSRGPGTSGARPRGSDRGLSMRPLT